MHPITFIKMHGLGNDFVVIDSRGRSPVTTPAIARALGDRNRGVGFDQLAEIRDSESADYGLEFWNTDGSRAGACGNASRCVASLMLEGREKVTFTTERGVLHAERAGDLIRVNMGHPQLDWDQVPLAQPADTAHLPIEGDPAAVGMGNPHCIFFVPDAEAVDLTGLGPQIEHHPMFPQRTNVEFASLVAPDHLRMRVWERGAGVTLACGSGTCATAVAAHLRGLTGRSVMVDVDGGRLQIDWLDDGVWMTGPVARVFDGTLSPEWLEAV
ncbi:diaminopimelate epimerase [Falsirhodobacter deserti]|uniref:diaminopimelate epimerase n=1 Tax=Falsirhodobacter deserti TaxID=1365611 RepID=UPI001F4EDBC1|nr:diaminopimelate epimerase [Falsirhodobacter deserti]